MDIICDIQGMYNEFSGKEKDIADYIMQYGENLENINITELAKNIGTSGATITRFAKKIGCESFVDMKIKLGSKRKKEFLKEEDSILSFVHKYYAEVISRTENFIDREAIYEIVSEIKKAKTIYIYGVGSSGLTAAEMMQRLLRMGFYVHSIADSHMMIINSSIVSQGDLVIALSMSGETDEIVKALKISKENGAKTAVVTGSDKSSAVGYADIKFIVYNSKFVDKDRFINTQFSTMYLLDLISMVLLSDKKLSDNMQITIDAIVK